MSYQQLDPSQGADYEYGSMPRGNMKRKPVPSPYRKEKSSFDDDSDNENAVGDRRSVQIIGYLPDLKPFINKDNERKVHFSDGVVADENLDENGNPFSPPQTPFFRMFDSKEAFSSWFREGSVRGSVFNLCSATLGAGALALPYAFSRAGWLLGCIMLLLGAAGKFVCPLRNVLLRDTLD